MSKILIIGCGGVASVAIQKCATAADVFSEICIASRTVAKCQALKEKLEHSGSVKAKITTAKVDADNVEELIALIGKEQPGAVLNLALPYQDLTIMDACLACGVTISIRPITKRRTRRIPHGGRFTRNGARKKGSPHILIIPGSGRTGRNLRRQVSRLCWAAALIPG